jgi:hypothetical protein
MAIKLKFKQVDSPFISYYIYRENSPDDMIALAEAGTITPINGSTLTLNSEGVAEYLDETATAGQNYYYMLRCIAGDGTLIAGQSQYSNIIEFTGGTTHYLDEQIPTIDGTDFLAWWTSLDETSFTLFGGGNPTVTEAAGAIGEEVVTWQDQLDTPLFWNSGVGGRPTLTSDSLRHIASTHAWDTELGQREVRHWELGGLGADEIGMKECCFVFGITRLGTDNPTPHNTDVVFFQIANTLTTDLFRIGQDSNHTPYVTDKVEAFRMWARSDGVGISDTGTEIRPAFSGANFSLDWFEGTGVVAIHVDWKTGKLRSYLMNDNKIRYDAADHDIVGGNQEPTAGTNGGVALGGMVTGNSAVDGASWPHGLQEMIIIQKDGITIQEIDIAMKFVADRMMLGMDHDISGASRQYARLPLIKDFSSEGDSLALNIDNVDSADFNERGFIGSGWNAIRGTVPTWAENTLDAIYIECDVAINNTEPEGTQLETLYAINNGTNNFRDRLTLEKRFDGTIPTYNMGVATGSSNSYNELFRSGWALQKKRDYTRYDHSSTVRHQGLTTGNLNEIWYSFYALDTFNNNLLVRYNTAQKKITATIDTKNLTMTSEIKTLAFDGSGNLWVVNEQSLFQIDVAASITAKQAMLLATVTLSGMVEPRAIEFTDVGGTEYAILGDHTGTAQGFIYIIDSSTLTDGSTFTAGTSEFKRFDVGAQITGICVDSQNELHIAKRSLDHTTSPNIGIIHSYGDVDDLINLTADETVINASTTHHAPALRHRDISKAPSGTGIWCICDGYDSTNDEVNFGGTIWHSNLDLTELVENRIGIYFTGDVSDENDDIKHEIYVNGLLIRTIDATLPSVANIGSTANSLFIASNLAVDIGTTANDYDTFMHKGSMRNFLIQPKRPILADSAPTTIVEPTVIPLTLVNPDAETGTTAGWTNELGGLQAVTDVIGAVLPPQGSYFFACGVFPETIASQRIDLLAATGLTGTQIDTLAATGDIWVRINWLFSHFGNDDQGQIGIRNLDTSQVQIDDNFSRLGVNHAFPQQWRKAAMGHYIDVGTRYIDVVIRGVLVAGSQINYHLDVFELNLYHF